MFENETILITGGTGSLGQELTKQLLQTNIRSIRIFSRSEYQQAEMKRHFSDSRLRFLIGDIRDKDRLSRAMNYVDYVIHTAALKRVEVCEYNPIEAHKTNVDGSENVVNSAIDNGVKKVIAISSDKAVQPINTYGVTKQHMEKIVLGGNVYGDTMFSLIRSGNFVTSKGNVFEIWKRQIEAGEPITVTDGNCKRFWIDLDRIAQFTIQCLDMMQGNEIFIPKMEESDLCDMMPDYAKVNHIALSPIEKKSEVLFNINEKPEDKGDYWVVKVKQAGGNI